MTTPVFWDQLLGPWRRTPQYTETTAGYIDVQAWADKGLFSELDDLGIHEELFESGSAPLGHDDPILETRDGRGRAVRYPTGTDAERATAHRENYKAMIEQQRIDADVRNVDLFRDSGLQGLSDEANDLAIQKLAELNATADNDLGTFDPVFDPASVGSIAAAGSLYTQEKRLLGMEIGLTPDEWTELDNVAAQHNAIALGTDDAAIVPAVPVSVRRLIGVSGEDYGELIAERTYAAPFYSLRFELRTRRQLDVDDYWIAVYDGNDVYQTTPRLTKVDEGIYVADENAVNLRRNDADFEYRYTLCHQHITNQVFARVALLAGRMVAAHSVRWSGNAG